MNHRELTFPTDSSNDLVITINDDRVPVVDNPLRWKILEIIGKEKTITEISEALHVTDARILYHVRRLADIKILHLEKSGSDARKWRSWPLVAKLIVHTTASQKKDLPEAIPGHVASNFNQAFLEVEEGLFGVTRQVSVNHNRARLSHEQASEFNRRLLELIEEFFPPGKGDNSGIKYGFYGILTPIDLHPLGESETK